MIDMPSTIETDGRLQSNLCFHILGFKSRFVFLKRNILVVSQLREGGKHSS